MKFAKVFCMILVLIVTISLAGCGGGESSVPTAVNSIKLQSDSGDYIGAGQDYSYTQANAEINVTVSGGHLSVSVHGDQEWSGDFIVPNSLSKLQAGRYKGLQRYPFNDPVQGLQWSGEGRGSNTLTGWFAIDRVTYVNGTLRRSISVLNNTVKELPPLSTAKFIGDQMTPLLHQDQ